MKQKARRLMALIFLLSCFGDLAAKISLQIDPPQVQPDEMFRLIFTIDNAKGNAIPDLTPLQHDFTIIGTERNMSYSLVNGQAQSVNQWVILLTAKKTGTLVIPAIQIGHDHSKVSSVEVSDTQNTVKQDDELGLSQKAVRLKTAVSQRDPYINQQVIYTVSLYSSERLLDAEYQPPQVEDALLIPLGNGRHYQTSINGQNYAVEEQRYAISPQKSGPLMIKAPRFKALVYDVVPKRVNIHPKATILQVKPLPSQYSGKQWLPSKQVTLREEYDNQNESVASGSTLVRTISLEANGIPAQLLPTLTFVSGSSFSSYASHPELENKTKQGELLGIEQIKVTYLLKKNGKIVLPAINVTWFNVTTGQEAVATLPSRTLKVIGKATATEKQTPNQVAPAEPKPEEPSQPLPATPTEKSNNLAWWLAGGFALAWLITLVLWVVKSTKNPAKQSKRTLLKQLKTACLANSPQQVQIALLQWAKNQWPGMEILNLHQLAAMLDDATLKNQLLLLTEALYSKEKRAEWRGEILWQSIKHYRGKPQRAKTVKPLPPINPK